MIRRLIWEVGINPMSLDWRRFLVAVNANGEVVSCGQIKPHGDGTRELASIAVRPGYRGQGLARAMIERLLAEAELPLYLTCRASLQPLYQKFGFCRVNEEEMTPYFRRIYSLATVAKKLFRMEDGMAVMVKRD